MCLSPVLGAFPIWVYKMKIIVNEKMTRMVAGNCKTYEREFSDKKEKNKDTGEMQPVRDITLKKKCDLKMQKIREKHLGEDSENPRDRMVTLSLHQLEKLMEIYDEGGADSIKEQPKTKVRLSSLALLLASPDLLGEEKLTVESLVREIAKKTIEEKKASKKKQDRYDRRKVQKAYDDKRAAKRKKERDMDPFHNVKKELSSLANGIMETDEPEDIDEKKEKKKKKQCHKGNAKHYPAGHEKAGEFAPSDQKDGSWSMYFTDGSQCKKGRAKLSGGSEQFTKATDCGRKDKDGKTKNKYKCSKPKEKYS
jgi:hypothetical protein